MKQPSIEIGGVDYPIDVSKVTLELWSKFVSAMSSGDQTATMSVAMEMVFAALGPEAKKLPITYLALIIPRILERIAQAASPGDVENEVNEILSRKRNLDS